MSATRVTNPPFHEYDSFALSPAFVLGYAFHLLERLTPASRVHGRRGALAALDGLLATLEGLNLEGALAAAEQLRLVRGRLSSLPRSSRAGAEISGRVAELLSDIANAVDRELRERSAPLAPGDESVPEARRPLRGGRARRMLEACPEGLRFDLREGWLAFEAGLFTAAVFHFYRVWFAMADAPESAAVSGVPEPARNPEARCNARDARMILDAIGARFEVTSR